jgi:hypothetical protein
VLGSSFRPAVAMPGTIRACRRWTLTPEPGAAHTPDPGRAGGATPVRGGGGPPSHRRRHRVAHQRHANGGGVAEILTSTLLGWRSTEVARPEPPADANAARQVEHDLTNEQMDRAPYAWGGCACGATDKPLQRDCVLPLSGDGRYTLENVVLAWSSCNTSKCNDEVTGWLRRKRLDERALLLRYVELRMALPLNVSAEPDAELAAPETNREAFPNRTRVLWPSLHVEGGSRSGCILDLDAGRAILHGTL